MLCYQSIQLCIARLWYSLSDIFAFSKRTKQQSEVNNYSSKDRMQTRKDEVCNSETTVHQIEQEAEPDAAPDAAPSLHLYPIFSDASKCTPQLRPPTRPMKQGQRDQTRAAAKLRGDDAPGQHRVIDHALFVCCAIEQARQGPA